MSLWLVVVVVVTTAVAVVTVGAVVVVAIGAEAAVTGVVTAGMDVDPPECCGCLATIGHGDLADLESLQGEGRGEAAACGRYGLCCNVAEYGAYRGG